MGVGRYMREAAPHVKLISMQPATGFHGLEGLKHMATALVPEIYDAGSADANLEVETEDAYAMVKRLAREEGLLVGISAGANVVAALKVARKLEQGRAGYRVLRQRGQVSERQVLGRVALSARSGCREGWRSAPRQ